MSQFHPLRVKEIKRETFDSVSIVLDVPQELKQEFAFLPGQYVTFKKDIGGEDVRRSYSICSSPLDGELRVGIKKVINGKFSTYATEQLKVNDLLETSAPKGRFVLRTDANNRKHYVAFAAGSGITPILSMMKTVLPQEPNSRFTLFYGNRQTPTIIFREDLEALKNRYMDRLSIYHIMTGEDLGSDLMTGRMDKEKIGKLASVLFDPAQVNDYYMCGPEPIIHAAREVLAEKGVDDDRVHFELFTSSVKLEDTEQKVVEARKAEEKKVHAKIKLVMDGDEFEFALDSDGKTILDAASEAGIDVPYSCKGAVCCTCIARVKQGEATMEKNYSLTDKEVAAGLILTCQAHPRTATVTVDYDDIW